MERKKEPQPEMNTYRIGDYAKYLGVTPDLLKHYEQFGLIRPVQRENGYRYYAFGESYKLLESMRLRNLGYSLRQCHALMYEMDEEQIRKSWEEQEKRLEQEIEYRRELLALQRKAAGELQLLEDRDSEWWIGQCEPAWFLPHTDRRCFIDDPRIYELLPEWMRWMPAVRSAARIRLERSESVRQADMIWGFLADRQFAQRQSLPMNDAVQELPSRKNLYYLCRESRGDKGSVNGYAHLWTLLDRLSLEPAGDILMLPMQSSSIGGDERHVMKYVIPIRE